MHFIWMSMYLAQKYLLGTLLLHVLVSEPRLPTLQQQQQTL